MEEFYLQIRTVHIVSALASGTLFLARALALNLAGASWPKALPVRWLAYAVDTTLLTAALMLTTIVDQYPFADAWLTTKIVVLLLYILLGYMALRGRTGTVRLASLAGAMLSFGFIYSVARAHHPLGLLA